MSLENVQAIERAISTLTSSELEELYRWFDQYSHPFDTRMQADLAAGRLDQAIGRALSEEQSDRIQPL